MAADSFPNLPALAQHLREELEKKRFVLLVSGQVNHDWLHQECGNYHEIDLEGIVDHPRSIAGTRLALFFRDLGYGKVKVSFRSTGDVDVNRFARRFGGGGHAKASGALIPGALEQVRERVVDEARAFVGLLVPETAPVH